MVVCSKCGKKFTIVSNLTRHEKFCKLGIKHKCSNCPYETSRKDNLKRHNLICCSQEGIGTNNTNLSTCSSHVRDIPDSALNNDEAFRHCCSHCGKNYNSTSRFRQHNNIHDMNIEMSSHNNYGTLTLSESAFSGRARVYDITPTIQTVDVTSFLFNMRTLLENLVNDLRTSLQLRGRLIAQIRYVRSNPQEEETFLAHFTSLSSNYIYDFDTWFQDNLNSLSNHVSTFANRGSNWVVDKVVNVEFNLISTPLLSGGKMTTLPKKLRSSKAVINVNSNSNDCFMYSILSIIHYDEVTHSKINEVNSYRKWTSELVMDGISTPVSIKDIPKFEKNNDIKVNIHLYENGLKGVRYNSNFIGKRTVNILLVLHNGFAHYCGIRKLSRLYSKFYTSRKIFCERCTQSFSKRSVLERHFQFCSRGKAQIEKMPKHLEVQISSTEHQLSPPLVIYADIECLIENKIHKPAAVGVYHVWHEALQSTYNNTYYLFEGENCIAEFLNHLEDVVQNLYDNQNVMTRMPMRLTAVEDIAHKNAENCNKCKIKFSEDISKVRDHDHITGKYRQALCSKCNLRLRLNRRELPVFFHNFKNYDSHIVCYKAIGKKKSWKLDVIAATAEKYITLSSKIPVSEYNGKPVYFKLKFLDSYQFLSASLAELAKSLKVYKHVEALRNEFPKLTDDILYEKGVFPYSYFSSLATLTELCLPPQREFYNDLTLEHCNDIDYEHAKKAWNAFNCKTFGDYMLAYLKLDVLLLADIFETFRKLSQDEDQVDPVHFVSLPHLNFTSALNFASNDPPHYIQDESMYNLFERGIRGGMTFTNIHRARARISELQNNPHESRHLAYLDVNNLYGSSLSENLPHSNFKWLDEGQVVYFSNEENIQNIDNEADIGYVFDLDLEYPSDIHDDTADFPLAPEMQLVEQKMFSTYMKNFYETLRPNMCFTSTKKLLLHQFDRENYVVHYSILKFYLSMGMKIKKVHAGIQFTQKSWLRQYIDMNSQKRAQSKSDFEKAFYKLKNNSLFGKTMENVRRRRNFKLVNTTLQLSKLANHPLYVQHKIFDEDLVGMELYKPSIVLNKLIYVGQAVLDYSKLEMYQLYYKDLIRCPLINRARLCGGDTDSFFLCLYTSPSVRLEDIFLYFGEKFDSSNYDVNHRLYSITNKARLGCFKDECAGKLLEEMVLLKPKMYSMKFLDSTHHSIRRAKGIQRAVVRRIEHSDYRNVYYTEKDTNEQITVINSKNHIVETKTFRKRGLSLWEDKRCWINKNLSLPYGHYSLGLPPPSKRRKCLPTAGDVE